MSYALARTTLVDIVRGVTPSDNRVAGEAARFVEHREGRSADMRTRSFTVEASSDGESVAQGPYVSALYGQPRIAAAMMVRVHYRAAPGKVSDLDVVIEEDARQIATELLRPENWQDRETTSICFITDIRYGREYSEDGAIALVFKFTMSYLGGPDEAVFYGAAEGPFVDQATIRGSLQARILPGRKMKFRAPTGSTKYAWWCGDAALGTPTFYIGGFVGGFTSIGSISFAVYNGKTYQLWRSTNDALGTVDVEVR